MWTNESIAIAGPVITILDMLCRMAVNSEAGLASTTLLIKNNHLGPIARSVGCKYCAKLLSVADTPVAQRPSSQQTAAGFEPRTFSTCMPQTGAQPTDIPRSPVKNRSYRSDCALRPTDQLVYIWLLGGFPASL